MDHPWKVTVRGNIYIEKMTEKFANRIMQDLRDKGVPAEVHYAPAPEEN